MPIEACSFVSQGLDGLQTRGAGRRVNAEEQAYGNRETGCQQYGIQSHTGLAGRARVVRSDVFIYLHNDPPAGFDYVHVAPPQYQNLWAETLKALEARPTWLNPDGVAVAQIDPREFVELPLQRLVLVDQRKYGSTLLCFYEKPGE